VNEVSGFRFPISLLLTSVNGDQITTKNFVSMLSGQMLILDTFTQYSISNPTNTSSAPTTVLPTLTPSTVTSSTFPTTTLPSPQSNECSAATKLIVPLCVYPGSSWTTVATSASLVEIVVIINPNNGPDSSPNSDYVTYMQMLYDAGVDLVGYVHTSNGNRSLSAVEADIGTYASQYPLLSGIFFDETATTSDKISYYATIYEYTMSMPGWKYDILNPGVVPDSGYLAVSTHIITLENEGAMISSLANPSWATCDTKDRFGAIVNTANSSTMESVVNTLLNETYFGYIYVTDVADGCCTYNSLCSYYTSLVSYISSLNP